MNPKRGADELSSGIGRNPVNSGHVKRQTSPTKGMHKLLQLRTKDHIVNENKISEASSIQTFSYPECINAAKKIAPFISQFDIDSVARAIFCINSWHENRSSQNSTYALNAALLNTVKFGTEPIIDYESFSAFFTHVKKVLPIFPGFEDEVVPVMGQTLIPFQGRWRRALYGCGTTLEYPRLYFANTIIDNPNRIAEFNELLDYVDDMSQELGGGGWRDSDAVPGDIRMPNADYWSRTYKWMEANPVRCLSANTIAAIDKSESYVENKCFVMNGDRAIPLFCPSILEDHLERSMAAQEKERNQAAIDVALLNQARIIFDSDRQRGSSVLAFPLFAINDKPVESCPSTFLILGEGNKATLFYNASCGHNDSGLKKLRKLFRKEKSTLEIFDYVKVNGKRRRLVLEQPNHLELTIVAYHDNIDTISIPRVEKRSKIADFDCGAADLMAILMMATNADEICSFFQFAAASRNTLLAPFVAASDYFIVWTNSNRQILGGAEDHWGGVAIALDFNETDWYFTKFFRNKLANFPRGNNERWILSSPFAYNLRGNERGFTEIIRKSDGQSLGLAKKLLGNSGEECFIRLKADLESARNVPLETFERSASTFPLLEDLLMCITNDAESEIAGLISSQGCLDLVYVMPGGVEADSLPTVNNELGIKALHVESGHHTVFYSVESEVFCNAISSAQDRHVECRFAEAILSLVDGSHPNATRGLMSKFSSLSHGGKMVDVESFHIPYRWQYGREKPTLNDTSKAAALKTVAYAVDDENIKPGRYFGIDANNTIRAFQKALSKAFEDQLSLFNKADLLVKFYEILASSSHSFYVNTKRYNSFSNLQDDEGERIDKKVIDQRENSRREMRAAMYSIKTLLTLSCHGDRIADASEVSKLVAIGGQLLTASDAADMLMFNPRGMEIEIADNCVATIIEDEELLKESRSLKSRQLRDKGHIGSDVTEDTKYIKLARDAFETDTGILLPCFLDVLNSLSLNSSTVPEKHYVSHNVISIEKTSILESIKQEFAGIHSETMVEKCIDFLTLSNDKLKEINGKTLEYLPFGNTKNRPNRLELKPLVEVDDRFIFSPIRTGLLQERWIQGIAERFLPAKTAFPALNTVMENWKHRYEKALEKDVQDLFLSEGFLQRNVFRGIELCKKGNHPQQLGDYDGLAYCPATETVWAIECKEFEKIESAFDYMQLQHRWFGEDGKLLKYERRIQYLRDNLNKVAADLGFEHVGTLSLRPYLVSNKPFMNAIGQSNFQIITLWELESLLEEEKTANSKTTT